jgi:hypothetical protein
VSERLFWGADGIIGQNRGCAMEFALDKSVIASGKRASSESRMRERLVLFLSGE